VVRSPSLKLGLFVFVAVLDWVPIKLKPVSTASHKGLRPYQEDRVFTATYEQGTLLAVFDGHGGAEVSQYAVEGFPGIFADEITAPKAKPRTALKKAIHRLAVEVEHWVPGSTMSLAFIPTKGGFVYCAVLGDSPIIIKDSKGAINISPDHNVRTNMAEKRAAEDRGGIVSGGYLYRSFNGPGLQMARALGDSYLRKVISYKPDIYSVRVNKDSFIVVATDGAFDPGHYNFEKEAEAVVKLVEDGADAKVIVDRAVAVPTGDNVSCILARFSDG
jgi:serine/threonine protein phosphatase PrpC